jgi:putative Mg2+ transporter-C (MgtC) family protein
LNAALESPDLTMSFVRLAVAFTLGLPVGWDRERRSRSAGLRTSALIAVGTCGLVLVGGSALGSSADEHADILYGIITGFGFIGGGVLLKSSPEGNQGMSVMVSLWVTVAIGVAAAYGLYALALATSTLTVAALNMRWSSESGGSEEHG